MGLPRQPHVARSGAINSAPPSASSEACDECERPMLANPIVLETAGHNICSACLEEHLYGRSIANS